MRCYAEAGENDDEEESKYFDLKTFVVLSFVVYLRERKPNRNPGASGLNIHAGAILRPNEGRARSPSAPAHSGAP